MNYLNLVRYKNLLFLSVLCLMMNYAVAEPVIATMGIPAESVLPASLFWLLTLAVVFIAAGGYVINDYFDTRIDLLNHPDSIIVGREVTKRVAGIVHHVVTAVGLALGLIVSYMVHSLTLGLIFLLVPGLLWFYSASYKRVFVLGNVVVALLAGCVPYVFAVAHTAYLSLDENLGELVYQTPLPQAVYYVLMGFAVFAALLTLVREIIKDAQDVYGDRELECHTIPVVLGDVKTKFVIVGLIVVSVLLAVYAAYSLVPAYPLLGDPAYVMSVALRFVVIGVVVPLVVTAVLVVRAKSPVDYAPASSMAKFTMVLGSLFSLVFYFLLAKAQQLAFFGVFVIPNQ